MWGMVGGGRDLPSWVLVEGGTAGPPFSAPGQMGLERCVCHVTSTPPPPPRPDLWGSEGGLGFLLCPLSRGEGGACAPELPLQPPCFSPGDANGEVRGGHEAHL